MSERKVKIITVITIIIAFILACILIFQFARLATLNTRKRALEKSYQNLQESIETYSSELNYYKNREQYLQDYAHEILNWAKNGETIYKAK